MKNEQVVTAAQMKAIEQAANESGLLYIQMMENAGRAAWAELAGRFPQPGRLLVVAGKGNNGGDGFVMARITNRELLRTLPVTVLPAEQCPDSRGWNAVVDALYGTGFHGALRPAGQAACGLLNQSRVAGTFLLAVDLPSGVCADTGVAANGAVQADLTVAFDSRKPAHTAPEAAIFCGEVRLADIGIPEECHRI